MLRVKLFNKFYPKAEEVCELKRKGKRQHHHSDKGATSNLRGSIDLRLPGVLPLAEDGGSQKFIPVLLANQVRRLEEDGRAVAPRQGLPRGLSSKGAVDSPRDGRLICLVVGTQVSRVVGRDHLLCKLSRRDLEAPLQSLSVKLIYLENAPVPR